MPPSKSPHSSCARLLPPTGQSEVKKSEHEIKLPPPIQPSVPPTATTNCQGIPECNVLTPVVSQGVTQDIYHGTRVPPLKSPRVPLTANVTQQGVPPCPNPLPPETDNNSNDPVCLNQPPVASRNVTQDPDQGTSGPPPEPPSATTINDANQQDAHGLASDPSPQRVTSPANNPKSSTQEEAANTERNVTAVQRLLGKSNQPVNQGTVMLGCMQQEGVVNMANLGKEEQVVVTAFTQAYDSLDQLTERVKGTDGLLVTVLNIPNEQLQN